MKERFTSWTQLLDHIGSGYPLWYHAPLDHFPASVTAHVRRDGGLHVCAIYGQNTFTADAGHLSRFLRSVARRTS